MSEEDEGDSCLLNAVQDGGVEDDKTELMAAAESGNLDAVRCLVESCADVNAADSHQITPLMYAASTDDNFAVVQFLVERGARVNAMARLRVTPLMCAAETGDIDVVRFLVERGAQINVTNTFGATALMRAAKAGKLDVVQFLVESGANVNAVQNDRWTSLLYAIENGHRQVAGFLIENGAAIEAAEENGRTPLMLAARKNHLECVRFLVEKKASIDAADNDGQTSLMHAARKGNSEVIRFLVGCGASVNAVDGMSATPVMYATWNDTLNLANVRFLVECGADVNARTDMGSTALMTASRNGDMDVVRFLVECGADVNARTDLGETALMSASRNGDMDVVRFLIESGADVSEVEKRMAELLRDAVQNGILDTDRYLMESSDANATDEQGKTLLMIAAQCSQLDVVRFLVDRGADLNAVDNLDNSTPLLYAAEEGHLDVVQFLIQRGSDVNLGNKEGVTPLLFAVKRNILPIIRLLIEDGADVNAADNWGRSSLFYGVANRNLDVIQLLVESGADVNAVNSRKNTPLMTAIRMCWLDGIQFLVNCSADVNAVGDAGLTPLMHATYKGKLDVFVYLVQHGADVRAVDKNESTMLMHAAKGGSLDVVEFVFKNCTDVKAIDKNGWTPLMHAVRSGNLDAVRFLLEKGADVNTVNKDGKTAAYIASSRGYTNIQSLLMQFKPHAHNVQGKTSTRIPENCSIPPFEVKLNQLVGAGNTSGNYRAKWLDADVAVRLFVPDATETTFADEVAVWHQLRHPNVIKLYGACNDGHHFFVCEWASNGSLVNFLGACEKRGETRQPWKFLREAALGLAYLHERKIVHGNLCSNSILIGSDGLAKLADFGVSGSTKDGSSGDGSVRWQSPEQLRGEEASFASDIYSFCLCAVEAVTGEVPWDGCDEEYCKLQKKKWDAVTHPDGFDAPVDFRFTAGLCTLASKMCGNDPRTRVSALVVVQMLERLAVQEAQEQQQSRPTPEPLYIHEYSSGELLCQWQRLRDVASQVGLDQPHVAVVRELEALYENLGKESRHPKVLEQFYKLVADCIGAIDVGSLQNRILRLSATRAQGNNVAIAYRHIDAIWAAIGDARSTSKEQKLYREEKRSMQMQVFVSEISQTLTVLDELKTENERTAFVAFLKAEINFHGSAYSAAQMAVLKKAYADITARLKTNTVVTTPKWFLPWYELEFDGTNSLAVGGFGTVYRAKWLESDVIVKRINSKKSNNADDDSMFSSIPATNSVKQSRKETREMFEHEVEVWFGLSHPHIVRLFGACHVGNPIFVCEYASNGSLDTYLRSHPNDMWLKLYEAALGVQYLHSRKIVHGDLKCNNIVVGRDNKAKVTDFGLSSANIVTGAWRWVAPECLKDGPSALSLASDVYALGMCVVEAMRIVESTTTNQQGFVPLPWGNLENHVVKFRVTRLKELPHVRSIVRMINGSW